MNTQSTLGTPDAGTEEQPGDMSFSIRLWKVLVAPGVAFTEITACPARHAHWIFPALLSAVTGVLVLFWIQTQPRYIENDLRTAQVTMLVDAGKMTEAEGQDLLGSLAPPISAAASVVLSSFLGTFWAAFVLWGMAKVIFQCKVPYVKALEVAGLSCMVLAANTLIIAFLVKLTGNPQAQPSLALFLAKFDPTNKLHLALQSANLCHLWIVYTLTLGLSRLCGMRFPQVFPWTFGYWIALRVILIVLCRGKVSL